MTIERKNMQEFVSCRAGVIGFVVALVMMAAGCREANEPAMSSDTQLNSLRIACQDEELFFIQRPLETEYVTTVPYANRNVVVEAEAADAKATVAYSPLPENGTVALHEGANTLVITVTAEDRTTTQTYTILVVVDEEVSLSGRVTVLAGEDVAPKAITVNAYAEASGQEAVARIGQAVVDDAGDALWQMQIPCIYRTVYLEVVIVDDRGQSYTKQFAAEEIPESGKEDIDLQVSFRSPQITSFIFSAAATEPADDLAGEIDQEQSRITVHTQQWIEHIDALNATFVATGTVTVDSVAQESGLTPNDFRREKIYTVTNDGGVRKEYAVAFESPQVSGLPILKIDTKDGQNITSKEDYVKTNIRLVVPDNPAYEFEHAEYADEIRGRGNTTWVYDKKPYRIKFDRKISLFDLEAAKSWVLLANHLDPTLLMNTVAFELGRRFGLPYTNHYIPVELFLNGSYRGSYLLTEQLQVGKGRVDIDEKEGFLVEVDSYYDEDPKFRTDHYFLPVMIKSPEDLPDDAGYDFVKNSLQALDAAVFDLAFPDNGYRDLIRMRTFVDYMLINELTGNTEMRGPKSVYMYCDKAPDTLVSIGPVWDFDWAFGYTGSGRDYFTGATGRPYREWHPFFRRFFDDPVFRIQYRARWNEMYPDIIAVENFIDEMAAVLDKSQKENFILWGNDQVDYAAEIGRMKSWWREHVASLHIEINRY
jgi:hypothetical protein